MPVPCPLVQDVSSQPVLGFDPLPPVDTIYSYVRPERYCPPAACSLAPSSLGLRIPAHRGVGVSDQLALSLAHLIQEVSLSGSVTGAGGEMGRSEATLPSCSVQGRDTWGQVAAALTHEGRMSLNRVRRVGSCGVPGQEDRLVAAACAQLSELGRGGASFLLALRAE